MRDSERYLAQADAVARLAVRAESPAEKAVYLSIAEGWRKLAGEAMRNERQEADRREGEGLRAAE
ncbi:hypothetical protein [Phenylobacterium sp.]|uniref:hypothetical protein n=1 Tax=Phenylobacterium sp. TaxID=1871053 RepID=UPI002CD05AD0|nr:hypothetical protein [Phenylobacterium sp.]HVI33666.1 hypothetical protein [Phenylobacterium sp.]